MPQDGYRFYKVQSRDSLTIVAVSQVTLKPSGEIHSDRSETTKTEHAELAAIRKISAWLDGRDITEQTEISLTTMATSSPCLKCQSAILNMLVDWREKLRLTVNYKLCISDLYIMENHPNGSMIEQLEYSWLTGNGI